jgi:hypothetical protein
MILDAHVHVFPDEFREDRTSLFPGEPAFELLYSNPSSPIAGRDDLLEDMDRFGVERAVIFGFPWESEEHCRRHNDYILESVAERPRRLTGLCCASLSCPGCLRELERCLDTGLCGVGELAVYQSNGSLQSHPVLREVLALCEEHDAPVLLHTNEPVGHAYPGKTPMTLADLYGLLRDHPRNRIILAHWGGGLVFYALLKREVGEVLRNVWFDTAASPFLYRPEIYRIAGEIAGFDRILFGSDYPLIKPDRYLSEIHRAGLPEDAMDMVTGANAARVYGGS